MTKETDNKLTLKAAICEFKKKDIAILKDKDNPFYKSKYADLASILGSVEAEMATVGLLITSVIKYHDANLVLETTLEHKDDDEKIVSVFPVFGGKPQEIGSSVTYARRYNIQSLLNLAAEDDDGNAANNSTKLYTTAAARTAAFNKVKADFMAAESTEELKAAVAEHKEELARLKQSDPQIGDELTKIYSGRQELLKGMEGANGLPDFLK